MRFYIASSRDGLDDVRRITSALEAHGMENAFPWPEHFTHRCSMETCGIADRDHLAQRELAAASKCDLFIGIARLGKGSHVELGAALARDVARVVLVGVDRADSVFYDFARVEHAADANALLKMLGCAR